MMNAACSYEMWRSNYPMMHHHIPEEHSTNFYGLNHLLTCFYKWWPHSSDVQFSTDTRIDVILNHLRFMLFNTWHCTRYILLCWIVKFSDSVWHWTMNSAILESVQHVVLPTWVHLFENMTHTCSQYNSLSLNSESTVSPLKEWIMS